METDERVQRILAVLDEDLLQIQKQANFYQKKANADQRYQTWFGAAIAVLGVAAPTLVTYSTQSVDPSFKLIAIILSAVVGAAGALQATFKWGERFRGTRLTALALAELESTSRLDVFNIRDSIDPLKTYIQAYELHENIQKKLQRIIRRHVLGEVELIAQELDTETKSAPKKSASKKITKK